MLLNNKNKQELVKSFCRKWLLCKLFYDAKNSVFSSGSTKYQKLLKTTNFFSTVFGSFWLGLRRKLPKMSSVVFGV